MRKIIFPILVILFLVILSVGGILFLNQKEQKLSEVSSEDYQPVNKDNDKSLVSLEKSLSPVPDDIYSFGAFCRVNYLPSSDEFFITFGGANPILQEKNQNPQTRAGGAEGGNGYSYKVYDKNFEYTGENGIVHEGGGDAASVMADGYYYFLTGGGKSGWIIKKIDPTTWQTVKTIEVTMDLDHEILSDQMLAWANGKLFASSLYDPFEKSERTMEPFTGGPSHLRIFDSELNQLDFFILDDEPHSNGSYLVYVDGIYNYITSSAYFGDLIVMQYDEDWNYLGKKKLDEWALWSQGAVFDPGKERFYVAYLDMDLDENKKRSSSINVVLGIFDKDWNLLEKVMVSNFSREKNTEATGFVGERNAGRPWVILQDEKLYVSYDTATEGEFDWQCETKIYSIE